MGGSIGVHGGTGVGRSSGSTKNYMAMNECCSHCSLHSLKV